MAPTAGMPGTWLQVKQLLSELQKTVAYACPLAPDGSSPLPPLPAAGITSSTPSSSSSSSCTPQSAALNCCCPWDDVAGLADSTATRLQRQLVLHESQHTFGAALLVAQLTRKLTASRARAADLEARCHALEARLAGACTHHMQAMQASAARQAEMRELHRQQVVALQQQAAELTAILEHTPVNNPLPGSPFSAASSSLCNISGLGANF